MNESTDEITLTIQYVQKSKQENLCSNNAAEVFL